MPVLGQNFWCFSGIKCMPDAKPRNAQCSQDHPTRYNTGALTVNMSEIVLTDQACSLSPVRKSFSWPSTLQNGLLLPPQRFRVLLLLLTGRVGAAAVKLLCPATAPSSALSSCLPSHHLMLLVRLNKQRREHATLSAAFLDKASPFLLQGK